MVARDVQALRRIPHRSAVLAIGVLAASAIASAVGSAPLWLSILALLSPGLALSALLPPAIRRLPIARLCATPTLAIVVSSVAIISVARLGVPLTPWSVHLVLLALVVGGVVLDRRSPEAAPAEAEAEAAAAASRSRAAALIEPVVLAGIVTLAAVLGWKVVGTTPVPGNDWAKYLLYASEIARQGHLLIDNPYWLGGVPFREDPGVPSLYGSALILSGAPAGQLAQVILLLSLLIITTSYAVVRPYVGAPGALATAALLTLAPATQNILGWHGLANIGGFAILPLVLGGLAGWLAGELDRRGEVGLALALIALAAAHRLTFAVTALTVLAVGVIGVALRRREGLVSAARIAGFGAVLGALVLLDLRARAATAGGTLPFTAYLETKIQWDLALRDISSVLAVLGIASPLVLVALRRLPRGIWPAATLGLIVLLLSVSYVVHLSLYYARMVYFMPLALAPLAGAGIGALCAWMLRSDRPARVRGALIALSIGVATLGVAGLARSASTQADAVRSFYAFSNPASLRGLDALQEQLRPGEPVATDRCWSFLAAWLLSTPTYPALDDQDIGPRAEVPLAKKGRAILAGGTDAQAVADGLGVRYVLLDPTCPPARTKSAPQGRVVFASPRLAIVRLGER